MESKKAEKIESLIEMERNNASNLIASVEKLSNIVIKEILTGIALDSKKHSGLYKAILNLLIKIDPAITEKDYIHLEDVIRKHIDVEKQMINESKQLLSSIKDKRITHLLQEIYNDEIKHHALMKRILESVIKRETIFEADWWDFIWEGSPGHGTP